MRKHQPLDSTLVHSCTLVLHPCRHAWDTSYTPTIEKVIRIFVYVAFRLIFSDCGGPQMCRGQIVGSHSPSTEETWCFLFPDHE